MKEKIRRFLFIVFLIIFIISMIYIVTYLYNMKKDEKDLSELQKIMNNAVDEDVNSEIIENNENVEIEKNNQEVNINTIKLENFRNLQLENSNIVAWVEIKNSSINYPILQGNDNDYYLYKNYKGEYSRNGSIFLDYRYNFSDDNQNFFVYGHNNNDQIMFNELVNYQDEKYFNSHRNITLITNQEVKDYEIIAVFKSEIFNKDITNVFKYYNYMDFETEEKFNEYINNCKQKSLYETGIIPRYGDKILTLSTCEYSKPNGRFVVVAFSKQEVEILENK